MRSRQRVMLLASVGVATTSAFALLATAVAGRDTARIDRALRPRLKLKKNHPVRRFADGMAPLGKWWFYVPASFGVAAYVAQSDDERARAGAASIVTGAFLAAASAKLFDRALPQPPAPPGHRARRRPVFPSGHALGPGTVSMTAAYLLVMEGVIRPQSGIALAFGVPIISAGGKLIEEKHWGSDVLGGLLAALSLSAACLGIYELAGNDDD